MAQRESNSNCKGFGYLEKSHFVTFRKSSVTELCGVYHPMALEKNSCPLGYSSFFYCDRTGVIMAQDHLQTHRYTAIRSHTFIERGP